MVRVVQGKNSHDPLPAITMHSVRKMTFTPAIY